MEGVKSCWWSCLSRLTSKGDAGINEAGCPDKSVGGGAEFPNAVRIIRNRAQILALTLICAESSRQVI